MSEPLDAIVTVDGQQPASPSVFATLAWLYAPADQPEGGVIVEADDAWVVDPVAFRDAAWAIWGRPASRRLSPRSLARFAIRRELALVRAAAPPRPAPRSLRLWDVQRLSPVARPGRGRRAARFALMSGALIRLGPGTPSPRVADVVGRLAGNSNGQDLRLRPSGDGSALAHIRPVDGRAIELRLATAGGLKDPRRNAAALTHLEEGGVPNVPRLVSSGADHGVRWTTETHVPGQPVRRLGPALGGDLVRWAGLLPRAEGPATAPLERLAEIASAFPRWADEVRLVAEAVQPIASRTRGIMVHGDLWIGNLLVTAGGLGGVIDWDTWHPAGMPGADLLHLLAMERRARTGRELGELWLEHPWNDAAYARFASAYWRAVDVKPEPEMLWAVGVDWWAAHLSAALRRGRRPAADPVWVHRNVDAVMPDLLAARPGMRPHAVAAAFRR